MAVRRRARFDGGCRLVVFAVVLSLALACGNGPTPPTALAISSVAPTTATSGDTVTIYGSGFRAGATVTFGGVIADVSSVSSSSIVARTPELAPGRVDIVVTNTNGESATLVGALTLVAFAVTSTYPEKCYPACYFSIAGTGLIQGTIVKFGGVPAPIAFVSETGPFRGIHGLLPPHAPGPVDITVTSPYGKTLTIPNGLTYVPPPVVTVSPESVTVGGSLTVSWIAEVISPIDYIHPYREGAEFGLDVLSIHVNGKSGSVTYSAPSSPGRYEFRYEPWEGQWGAMAARSNVVTVTPASPEHAYDIAVRQNRYALTRRTHFARSATGGDR
jgi:hypothetical protein